MRGWYSATCPVTSQLAHVQDVPRKKSSLNFSSILLIYVDVCRAIYGISWGKEKRKALIFCRKRSNNKDSFINRIERSFAFPVGHHQPFSGLALPHGLSLSFCFEKLKLSLITSIIGTAQLFITHDAAKVTEFFSGFYQPFTLKMYMGALGESAVITICFATPSLSNW